MFSEFVVNGSAIPDVDFDVGESYAGLLPISSAPNETRQLFFWFVFSVTMRGPNDKSAKPASQVLPICQSSGFRRAYHMVSPTPRLLKALD